MLFFPSILTALVFTQTNPTKIKINKTTTCFHCNQRQFHNNLLVLYISLFVIYFVRNVSIATESMVVQSSFIQKVPQDFFLFRILLRHCLFCSFCPICLSVIGMHFLPYASYFFNSPTPSGYGLYARRLLHLSDKMSIDVISEYSFTDSSSLSLKDTASS